jgi:hypothetical protein
MVWAQSSRRQAIGFHIHLRKCSVEKNLRDDFGSRQRGKLKEILFGKSSKQLNDLRGRPSIGVFLMHVEQVDRMGHLMTIKDRLFHDLHAITMRRSVNDCGAHASARRLPANDQRVHAMKGQVRSERRAEERAWRGFL